MQPLRSLVFPLAGACWLLVAAACNCQPDNSAAPTVEVQSLGAFTVVPTANGEDHDGDPALVGRKEVVVQVSMSEPTELRTVLLTWWLAGHNAGSQTIETSFNEVFTPAASGGIATSHRQEIPGSADVQQCEGLYYMWTVNYRRQDGTPGVFVGQPQLVLPTKKLLPNGLIEQALCGEVPGPGA